MILILSLQQKYDWSKYTDEEEEEEEEELDDSDGFALTLSAATNDQGRQHQEPLTLAGSISVRTS